MLIKKIIFAILFTTLSVTAYAQQDAKQSEVITVVDYIKRACSSDTAFAGILIDELKLKYKRALALPASDIVMDVESKCKFFFDPGEEDTENSVSLSKLFPYTATEVTADYDSAVSSSTRGVSSGASIEISQAIAKDAFGRNTRLLDKITGIEVDVARYQIAEAYEEYLATIVTLYYDWYSAYENLKTARNAYNENLRLLENIKEREKNKIALPIDVNKISLQVLAKKENLISRQQQYDAYLNDVRRVLHYGEDTLLSPTDSSFCNDDNIDFLSEYEKFKDTSRTARVLALLEDKSSLQVDKYADELLPSINLVLGYSMDGDSHRIETKDNAYAGISIAWPLPGQTERADYETSKIELDKTRLSSVTVHNRLYSDLKNLNDQIRKRKELILLSDDKVALAEAIVKDETENYSLGRSSLNDLIDEVNKLEDNKFSRIAHSIQLRKLFVEWLRLTDRLVKEDEIF